MHPYAAPQSWLGAYYTLRQEGPLKCERAIANREKRKGKNAPARGRFIVSAIEKLQIDELVKKDPWRGPAKSEHGIQSGETLEVWFKPAIDQPEDVTDASQRSASDPKFGRPSKSLCRRRPGPHIGLQAV